MKNRTEPNLSSVRSKLMTPTKPFQRLDELCRSERYFTATLFGYLLLFENLRGVLAFINFLCEKRVTAIKMPCAERSHEIEVITELNVFRDHSFWHGQLPRRKEAALIQSMPDIVIRYDDVLFVIEAKFFGVLPSTDKLCHQMKDQKRIIKFIDDLYYGRVRRYVHLYLGPRYIDPAEIGCDGCITWADVADFGARLVGAKDYAVMQNPGRL